jgi:malate dehydrogenase
MPKSVVVLAGATAPAMRLATAEVTVLDPAQLDALPPCDVMVLLGDPAVQGSHEDLLRRNVGWVRAAADVAARRCPGCVLVVAAKPVNALALAALRAAGLPRTRVLGVSGLTDSRRLAGLIANALGVGAADVQAAVMGGCGESLVALPRLWSVGGIPAEELLSRRDLDRLAQEAGTASSPEEIVAAAAELAGALLDGGRRLRTCSVFLDGEYGVQGIFLAVPVVLGPAGLERIVQLNLKVEERMALQKAAAVGRALRGHLEVAS